MFWCPLKDKGSRCGLRFDQFVIANSYHRRLTQSNTASVFWRNKLNKAEISLPLAFPPRTARHKCACARACVWATQRVVILFTCFSLLNRVQVRYSVDCRAIWLLPQTFQLNPLCCLFRFTIARCFSIAFLNQKYFWNKRSTLFLWMAYYFYKHC